MLGKLALVLKSKLAIAILGAVLVAAGGSAVAMAASGNSPFGSQAHSSGGNDGQRTSGQHDSHQAEGTITSIDSGQSSFVVKTEHSASITVVVSSATVYTDGPHGFGDLKAGMSVEVDGSFQSDGTLAATRVHGDHAGIDDDRNDDHDGNSNHSGSGSDGSGRGGHDDGAPHD